MAFPLSFGKAFPTPPEFEGKPSPPPGHKAGPNELTRLLDGSLEPFDWYTWRLVHWGTKWDLSEDIDVVMDYKKREIVYRFDTAWSPPTAWVTGVSKKYPTLVFRLEYEESGCDFEGHVVIKRGAVLEEHQGDYTRCFHCNERGCNCTPAQKRGEEE